MILNEILERSISSFTKEKNENLTQTINYLVDEFDKNRNELNSLLEEIENQPIEDDFFFKNIKKEDYKKRAVHLEKNIMLIDKRYSELIIILSERYNKKS
jgi:predicted adenine nucleotide alpha hydrolase (AANH) superfamily ATPase